MKKIISNYLFGIKNPNLPSYLTFYVNNICQLRCDMCFYWDSMQKKTIQLTTEQIEKLAKSLPNLIQLSVTGGEPTLRKDLPEVVKIFCSTSNTGNIPAIIQFKFAHVSNNINNRIRVCSCTCFSYSKNIIPIT